MKSKRLFFSASIFLLSLLLISIAAIFPITNITKKTITNFIIKSLSSSLSELGLEISYKNLSPHVLSEASINNIQIKSQGLTIAMADAINIKYNFMDLLKKKVNISLIKIEGLNITSKYSQLEALFEKLKNFANQDTDWAFASAQKPVIELRNTNIGLEYDNYARANLNIKYAAVFLDSLDNIQSYISGQLTAHDSNKRLGLEYFSMPFAVDVSINKNDTNFLSASAVIAGDSEYGSIAKTRLNAQFGKKEIRLAIKPSSTLKQFEAVYNLSKKELKVDAVFDKWKPSTLYNSKHKLITPWLEAKYSGAMSVTSDMTLLGTKANVDISSVSPLNIAKKPVMLALKASGSAQSLNITKALASNNVMSLSYAGNASITNKSANGLLSAEYTISDSIKASAAFEVSGADSSWFAYSPSISAADAHLWDATLSLDFTNNNLQFYFNSALPESANKTQNDKGILKKKVEAISSSENKRIIIEGSAIFSNGTDDKSSYLEAVCHVGTIDFSSFPKLLEALISEPAAKMLSPLSIEGDVSVFSNFTDISYNASRLLFVYDSFIKGFGVTQLYGNLKHINLNKIEASIAGYPILGSISFSNENKSMRSFTANISVKDIPYSLTGTINDNAIDIYGNYELRLSAKNEHNQFSFNLNLKDMPIPIFGSTSFLSTSLTGRYALPNDWGINLVSFSLSQASAKSSIPATVSMHGFFDQNGGTLREISISDSFSKLNGSANVTWKQDEGFLVVDSEISNSIGEYYSLKAEYTTDNSIKANITVKKAILDRWQLSGILGLADIEANVLGTISQPKINFKFTINGGHRLDTMIFADGSGTYADNILTLTDARIRQGSKNINSLSVFYDIAKGQAVADAFLDVNIGGNQLLSQAHIEASIPSIKNIIPGSTSKYGNYVISGTMYDTKWMKSTIESIPLLIIAKNTSLYALFGENNEAQLSLSENGEISASFAKSMPLSFFANGHYTKDYIDITFSDTAIDMPFLFRILNTPVIAAVSGTGHGTFSVKGKLTDPRVTGVFNFDNLFLAVPDYVSVPIGPITCPLYFTGKTMEASQTDIPCANTVVTATLNSELTGGIPLDLTVSVKSDAQAMVPVKIKLLGFRVDGFAAPNLLIDITPDKTKLTGEIGITAGDIVLTTEIGKQTEPGLDDADFSGELDISFGKSVRVYFPDNRLPILYGLTDPSSHISASFDTLKGDFSIKGKTLLRGGTIFYIQRNFYLKQASLNFDENQTHFDPTITLEAETRSSNDTGPVLILLTANKSRLSNLSFRLESIPAMTEVQIQQLLGKSLVKVSTDGKIDWGSILVENSDLIPQLGVLSVIERNIQTWLGLDMFMARTLVVQRFLYGVIKNPDNLSIGDYLHGSSVAGGKYIGDKVYLQAMLTLIANKDMPRNKLDTEFDISLEWQAPHFTLLWSVKPKNFRAFFLEDQKFAFLWRFALK